MLSFGFGLSPLLLFGAACYLLGWRGTLLWLTVCGVVTLLVTSTNWGGNTSCDGGLCIFGYLAGGLVWLAGCSIAWLLILLMVPKPYRSWRWRVPAQDAE